MNHREGGEKESCGRRSLPGGSTLTYVKLFQRKVGQKGNVEDEVP